MHFRFFWEHGGTADSSLSAAGSQGLGQDGLRENIVKGHQDRGDCFSCFAKLTAGGKNVIFTFRVLLYAPNKNSKPGSLRNVSLDYYLLDREHPRTPRGSMSMPLGIYKFETYIYFQAGYFLLWQYPRFPKRQQVPGEELRDDPDQNWCLFRTKQSRVHLGTRTDWRKVQV